VSDNEVDVLEYQQTVRALRDELNRLRAGRDPDEKPKRVTVSEIMRAHLERMAHAGGEHSSVELSRNAKGDTQIKVAVRTGESAEAATIEDAAAKAREVYDALRMVYPLSGPAD
jgi:hypothetical protein